MDLTKNPIKVILAIIVVNGLGILSGIFGMPGQWYQTIQTSTLTPPNYVFPIAWTILYTLIGVSGYITFKQGFNIKAKSYFIVQLALNYIWTPVFFGSQAPVYGFIIILLMIGFTALIVIEFYRENKTATYLLFPYLSWIIFAAYLNLQVILLN